jgi:hypothetical protein
MRSEFSRRSTVRRTFCAAATLAAGGISADFRVLLLRRTSLGFAPFEVARCSDRDDVVVEDADREGVRRPVFFLAAALPRPPAVLVAMVPALHSVVMLRSAV